MQVSLCLLKISVALKKFLRNDLDDDEYEDTKRETIEQMEEFNKYLVKLTTGNMTLIDDIGSMQLVFFSISTKIIFLKSKINNLI